MKAHRQRNLVKSLTGKFLLNEIWFGSFWFYIFTILVSPRMQKIKVKNFLQWQIQYEFIEPEGNIRTDTNICQHLVIHCFYFVEIIFQSLCFENLKKNPFIRCLLFWHKRHIILETNNKQGRNSVNVDIPKRKDLKVVTLLIYTTTSDGICAD